MRAVRAGALIGVALAGGFTVLNVVNCASATTITLEVRGDTNLCAQINETGIVVTTVEKLDNALESELQEFQSGCAGGKIGTLVITPRSSSAFDRNASVGIRVVAGLNGKSANQCDDAEGKVGENCIIAKREVQFVEGANVPVTVTLSANCVRVTCPDDYECDPEQTDIAKRCVPREVLNPGNSSGGEPDSSIFVPPIDSGLKEDADAGPLTPKERCEYLDGVRIENQVWNVVEGKGSCTIDCALTNDCTKNVCPPGLDCIYTCNKANGCAGVDCSGNPASCTFLCNGNNGDNQCRDVTCDAGTCEFSCAVNKTACSDIVMSGKTNTMKCTKADGDPSCNNVRCIPGPAGGTKCSRNCDGPDAGGCGPVFACDAGDCAAFEGHDGGPLD